MTDSTETTVTGNNTPDANTESTVSSDIYTFDIYPSDLDVYRPEIIPLVQTLKLW